MNQKILVYGGTKNLREAKILSYLPPAQKGGNHPDLLKIDLFDDKKSIGINDLKIISEFIITRPLSEKFKVIIIFHADLLTEEAQNSLLKILEGASKYIQIYLEAPSLKKILPTIISRCMLINLGYPKITPRIDRKNFFDLSHIEKLEWAESLAKIGKEDVIQELHLILEELKYTKVIKDISHKKKFINLILDTIENLTDYNLNLKITILNLVMSYQLITKA